MSKPSKEIVRKLIENRGQDTTECQKVLGSLEAIYLFADIWERHADWFHLIAVNEILVYTDTEEFDYKQLEAYKKGLAAIPLFFQNCLEERQIIEKNKLKASTSSSAPVER